MLALQFKGGMSFNSLNSQGQPKEIVASDSDEMSSQKDTERSDTVGSNTLGLNDRCSKISFDGSSFIRN